MQSQCYQAGKEVTFCGSFVDGPLTGWTWYTLASGLPSTSGGMVTTCGVAYKTGWSDPHPVGVMFGVGAIQVYFCGDPTDYTIVSVNLRYHI